MGTVLNSCDIEIRFPNLKDTHYEITSTPTYKYNCLAWAAGVNNKIWDYVSLHKNIVYWPRTAQKNYRLETIRKIFYDLGYFEEARNDLFECDYEKVAIYSIDHVYYTHVARQEKTGYWTSKLGKDHDIEHTLSGLEGIEYGKVVLVLKRKSC
ncbi:DUF7689 domain-containing protein [Chlorobium ferrooxidans]|uniref:DUF7689 domain-containing protein n=1 Tax=Chlorobium ferrooxidans TaxID=84205 RepID=UPI00058CFB89|nr:hypothetical protein [Chlorobium ferrooxidans]